jgi:hypothetical protein
MGYDERMGFKRGAGERGLEQEGGGGAPDRGNAVQRENAEQMEMEMRMGAKLLDRRIDLRLKIWVGGGVEDLGKMRCQTGIEVWLDDSIHFLNLIVRSRNEFGTSKVDIVISGRVSDEKGYG